MSEQARRPVDGALLARVAGVVVTPGRVSGGGSGA